MTPNRDINKENAAILAGLSLRDILLDENLTVMEKYLLLVLSDVDANIKTMLAEENVLLEERYQPMGPIELPMMPIPIRTYKQYGIGGHGRIREYLTTLFSQTYLSHVGYVKDMARGYKLSGVVINRGRYPILFRDSCLDKDLETEEESAMD